MKGTIIAVCTSPKKGERKKNVGRAMAKIDHGLVTDAHAGNWHRQISLLAMESIEKMQAAGLTVGPGDFAENLTCQGIDLVSLPVGTVLQTGNEVVLEISQIGKECHSGCAIFKQTGKCIMPKEGVFAKVITGGTVRADDEIKVKK